MNVGIEAHGLIDRVEAADAQGRHLPTGVDVEADDAVAVMMLLEEGKLRLSESICDRRPRVLKATRSISLHSA